MAEQDCSLHYVVYNASVKRKGGLEVGGKTNRVGFYTIMASLMNYKMLYRPKSLLTSHLGTSEGSGRLR